ncbi:BTB domain-containing protein [Mycena kentingensis (nom. inval.)]|nr:BTB domain-containing protein [Mycena kentingensis (nom. inval.)]
MSECDAFEEGHGLTSLHGSFVTEDLTDLSALVATLRLSKKYDMARFRGQCVAQLKNEFPTTLREFDELDGWSYIAPGPDEDDTLSSVVNLAREVGLYSILPLAFHAIGSPGETGCATELSPSDQIRRLEGHLRVLELPESTTMRWLLPGHLPGLACLRPEQCKATQGKRSAEIMLKIFDRPSFLDHWKAAWGEGLCKQCVTAAKNVYRAERAKCWEKLPSLFGFPDWEELKKMDFE